MKTQGFNTDVVFLSGVRTGFGTFGGTLKDLSAIELGAVAGKHADVYAQLTGPHSATILTAPKYYARISG